MKIPAKSYRTGWLFGSTLALVLAMGPGTQAQNSLPLDTDLATDPPAPSSSAPASNGAVSDESSDDSPSALPNLAVPDTSLPQISQPTAGEITPAPPMADLSTGLVGQNIDTIMPMLEQAGWMVVTRTPQLIQMDRGEQGLDLGIEGSTGEVVEAELIGL